MLKHRATAEGTLAYANRHADLPGNFRPMLGGLSVSSIGIGTYLGEADDETDRAYAESIRRALRGGINVIDTAVNYRFQRAERTIGRVLSELVAAGELRREEVVVASKGGYITFDGAMPSNPRAWFEEKFVSSGIVGPGDLVEGSHCMTPRYLGAMLEMSRANLGLETIDIYYLHNPETQLGSLARPEFLERIGRAFEFLERQVADGKIGVYGTATWHGYRLGADERQYLQLEELVQIATRIAGEGHHFRAIQLPFNLAMPEALTLANQQLPDRRGSALRAANSFGIAVCASATLLQGRLAHGLPAIMAQAFEGLTSDAQRALQFVRSAPGVNVALVGMKSPAHVDETLHALRRSPASMEAFSKLFTPNKRA
ncbi:MAG TPA: aldo/keto reductase [Candidatus Binataceae bacterium]|nr:aldo/keto reductase [Candidatus Binataceae bacterium]